jgi:hypothetical protein
VSPSQSPHLVHGCMAQRHPEQLLHFHPAKFQPNFETNTILYPLIVEKNWNFSDDLRQEKYAHGIDIQMNVYFSGAVKW